MGGVFIGIDPGSTGAVAIIHPNNEIEIFDTPLIEMDSGRKQIDYRKCAQIILGNPVTATYTIERQWARPPRKDGMEHGTSSVAAFGLGYSYGVWLGILGALDCNIKTVTPQAWKKSLMPDSPKEKDASRDVADTIFPGQRQNWWSRKKDHGRTDALLIAEYGRRLSR